METLTVKVDSLANDLKERYKDLPIRWATEKPNIEYFTSIITDRKLALTEIREKAWKRKYII